MGLNRKLAASVLGGLAVTAALAISAVALSNRDSSSFAAGPCAPPYSATSPWNTPIADAPVVHPKSRSYVKSLGDDTITSNPMRYSHPIYTVGMQTLAVSVRVRGVYSNVITERTMRRTTGGITVRVPIPPGARPSPGTDSPLIVVRPATGDEWGFWRIKRKSGLRRWVAVNGYHYNIKWSAVPPRGFGSGGAGIPYLAGRIRPCELRRGRIDHALAFAYNYPARGFVYPATKSDGVNRFPYMPEGTRLQLDPSLSDARIKSWGCKKSCLVIARALQTYGMYVINRSGRDKIYAEDNITAQWTRSGFLTRETTRAIRKGWLRVVKFSRQESGQPERNPRMTTQKSVEDVLGMSSSRKASYDFVEVRD